MPQGKALPPISSDTQPGIVNPSIDELVADASRGSEPALEALLAESLPRLQAFVRLRMGVQLRAREETVDVVQSVCRTLLEGIDRLEYRGEGPFYAWLFTAATNKLRARARHLGRECRNPDRELPLDAGASHLYASILSPSQAAVGQETAQQLEAAFDRLPDDYREAITLSRIAGLDTEELAAHMGRTVGATRMLLGRALSRLGEELERMR